MKVVIKDLVFTDDTQQSDEKSYFVKTAQNQKYINTLKKYKQIITPKELLDLIDTDIKIIGLTGTNGKTTTAAAIYSFLLDLDKKCALQGTRGFFINSSCQDKKSLTTPPILQTLYHLYQAHKQDCKYFVMEVSSHAIAQKRIENLPFYLKIFTNLSQDHLDFHESMEKYAQVKRSFFDDEGLKLINKDDKLISYNPKGARTYGVENLATYKVSAYGLKDGIEAVMINADKILQFHSSLRGKFNLYNLACAVSAVDLLENPDNFDMVQNFLGVSGRMEVVHEKPTIIVDFAHTPDGIQKVLESLQNENLVVVFGAGGDRDKSKRPIMAQIVKKYSKKIYITSDNPRSEDANSIIDDIVSGLSNTTGVTIQADRKKAIHRAISELKSHECLLILGKGDEDYQEIKGVKHPFDDRVVVKEYFKSL